MTTDKCKKCHSTTVIMEMAEDCSIGLRCKDCGAFSSKESKSGMTEAEIEAGKSPKGGFTRQQLAEWGVPWPTPKGWKKALMEGRDPSKINNKPDTGDLLRKVVLAVVESGNFDIIKEMDDVHAFFGCRPYQEAMDALKEGQKNLHLSLIHI